jgi:hypothetical protein
LFRYFDKFLIQCPKLNPITETKGVYIKVDGKYFGRWGCILVFKEGRNIIYWDFVIRENYFNYLLDFTEIKRLGYNVLGITSDWHGSLISASEKVFLGIPHQRCLVHTQRFCQSLLTQRPETEAGIKLLEIVKFLNQIKNHDDKEIWIKWLSRFEKKYQGVINERTYTEDKTHWWYTHKNTRRVFRTLKGSINNLFLYLDFPGLPKDTNGLEADFKHLVQKINVHKGLKRGRKIDFVNWYFYLKSVYSKLKKYN